MNSTPDPTDPVVDVVIDAGAASGDSVTDADADAVADETAAVEVEVEVDAAEEATDGAPVEGFGAPSESSETAEVVVPVDPDPQLLAAHDLALAALREITPAATIGDPAGYRVEADGVVSLRFANLLAGYPGWFWTVSLARVEDAEPTVLEVELLPGDGALLAPDWVPWAVRLADYHAAQAALAEAAHEDDDHEELEDVDDLDASDFDEDGSPILHAGDVDGVDIDELADAAADDDEDDDSGEDDADDEDDFDDDADDSDEDDFDDDSDEDDFDDDSDEDDSDEDDFDDDDSGEEGDEDVDPEGA